MENKFVKMESKANTREGFLLPGYFFKIGLGFMISGLAASLIIKLVLTGWDPIRMELLKTGVLNCFILGLLFIAWSKDKVEDEMTLAIRLKAIAWAFAWAAIYVIVKPFVDFLMTSQIEKVSGTQVVLSMLIVYLLVYYLNKRIR